MHYGECSCYQDCKNIEIKTIVLEEHDYVIIGMNQFDAEKFFNVRFLSASGRSMLITCCSLFYLTGLREGRQQGVEKEEKMCL